MEAQESEEIRSLKESIARRDKWMERMRNDYNDVCAENESLREDNARLTKELNNANGDIMKLQARIAELEAKLPPEPGAIILPGGQACS